MRAPFILPSVILKLTDRIEAFAASTISSHR
jgi:hypothetical protein